jgi:signal transduction histidine kinase
MPHLFNERPGFLPHSAASRTPADVGAWTTPPPGALVLSAQPADARSHFAAFAVILVSMVIFAAFAPFAKYKLDAYPVFIPLNQTVLIINDVITALLLFMQLRVTRSPALVVLACGYVYAALMASAHLLTFPGVFTPNGLLGAGAQTTAYLFVFWHSGFSLAVMAYIFLKQRAASAPSARMPRVAAPVAFTALLAGALVLLATLGNHLFAPLLDGNGYSTQFNVGRHGQWLLTALAIWLVWRNRPRSVLDLWLLVALCASFIEIGLVAIFNAGRYDLGFYAGRVYALLSSLFVLAVLRFEQARLYSGVFASRALQRAEAEARASRDVLRLAMAGGGMGAWSIDLPTGKAWVSVEFENVLGFAPGTFKATPRSLLKRLRREDVPRMRGAIAHALASGQDFAVEVRFCHAQRRWRWMDVRGRATIDATGNATAIIGVVMDVTAQHDVQAALRENDRRKDEFLATLAHELRNPLAPIRYAVEVMGRLAPLPAPVERVRGILDSQSRQLSRLVDDLLEVSRITQGKVQLRKARVCVGEALRDALDATAPAVEAAKHELTVSMEDDRLYTEADAGRLTQVFVNLLHNATKFTPQGGRIAVSARRQDGAALISIKDSGIGIEPEHLDRIFGIFSQVQSSLDPGHGGLGIGLALVRGFVELHGGSVHVHSDGPGCGTEFSVRLPLHDPAPQAERAGEPYATAGSDAGAQGFTRAWQG